MKSRLYWKIFLWFWLAMLVISITTVFFSNYIIRQHYMPIKNNALISAYTVATQEIYMLAGKRGVVDLYQRVYKDSGAELYLLNERGQSVLTYRFPNTSVFITNLLMQDNPPEAFFKKGPWMLGPEIKAYNGEAYRILAKLPPPRSVFQKKNLLIWCARFIIAITIIGIICYILSMYVTKPIRKLKLAAGEIGKGNLSIRVADQLLSRGDEIADLAIEFDRMASQLENLLSVQNKTLHDVSHELRSPLARLQVALELAERNSDNTLNKEFDRINLECERLDELIGEILSWSRLQTLTAITNDDIDLLALLKTVIQDANYEFSALATQAELKTDIENIQIKGNTRLLHRAIENVLRNALRFTKTGTTVSVLLETNEDFITIKVRDKGPGVAENELENIFRPFYRLLRQEKANNVSYGLGLAITEQAIKLHQGKIAASNLASGGLEVCLCLPFSAAS